MKCVLDRNCERFPMVQNKVISSDPSRREDAECLQAKAASRSHPFPKPKECSIRDSSDRSICFGDCFTLWFQTLISYDRALQVSSRHNRAVAHMNSQCLWQHTPRPEQGQAKWGPTIESEVTTWVPSLIKKLFAIAYCWQRWSLFSPMECHYIYQPHCRAGPIPRKSWPTPNKLHGIFVGFLFHFILVVFFLFASLF